MVKFLHRIQSTLFRSPKILTKAMFLTPDTKQFHRLRFKFRRIKFLSIPDTKNFPPDVKQKSHRIQKSNILVTAS